MRAPPAPAGAGTAMAPGTGRAAAGRFTTRSRTASRQRRHAAGAGFRPSGRRTWGLDVHARPHAVRGRHGAGVDPVLPARGGNGAGRRAGARGPRRPPRRCRGRPRSVRHRQGDTPPRRPAATRAPTPRAEHPGVGGGGGPAVARRRTGARAGPEHVRPVPACGLGAGAAVAERELAASQRQHGQPSGGQAERGIERDGVWSPREVGLGSCWETSLSLVVAVRRAGATACSWRNVAVAPGVFSGRRWVRGSGR